MIQSPLDLAEELAHALGHRTAGEVSACPPIVAAFVSPPTVTFIVRTVEGRAYRVAVTEEPDA